jgi:hypothetical protein
MSPELVALHSPSKQYLCRLYTVCQALCGTLRHSFFLRFHHHAHDRLGAAGSDEDAAGFFKLFFDRVP